MCFFFQLKSQIPFPFSTSDSIMACKPHFHHLIDPVSLKILQILRGKIGCKECFSLTDFVLAVSELKDPYIRIYTNTYLTVLLFCRGLLLLCRFDQICHRSHISHQILPRSNDAAHLHSYSNSYLNCFDSEM